MIRVGTEVFHHGDIDNQSKGFGTVIDREEGGVEVDGVFIEFPAELTIETEDGEIFNVSESSVCSTYDGTARHRVVTKEAYEEWRQSRVG